MSAGGSGAPAEGAVDVFIYQVLTLLLALFSHVLVQYALFFGEYSLFVVLQVMV